MAAGQAVGLGQEALADLAGDEGAHGVEVGFEAGEGLGVVACLLVVGGLCGGLLWWKVGGGGGGCGHGGR